MRKWKGDISPLRETTADHPQNLKLLDYWNADDDVPFVLEVPFVPLTHLDLHGFLAV